MDVLVYLMTRSRSVVSPQEILKALWPNTINESRLISKRINQIRRVLGDNAKKPLIIQTIPKRGYQIIAEVDVPGHDNNVMVLPGAEAVSEQAKEAFNRGMSHLGTQDYFASWLPAATSEFEAATAHDPGYGLAWSYLALVYVINAVWSDSNNFSEARAAADRALCLNDQLGVAHTALGYIKLLHEWDIPSASKSFTRAYDLDSSDVAVLHGYQLLLRVQERTEEAIAIAKKLKILAPGNVRVAAEQIKFYYQVRMYEQAVAQAEHVKTLMPGYADFALAAAYHKLGRFEDSFQARLDTFRLHGARCDNFRSALEKGWEQGGYEGALRALSMLHSDEAQDQRDINEQEMHVVFDSPEPAFSRIARGIQQKKPALIGLLHNPDFDELRIEPAFGDLLKNMNLAWDPPENAGRAADVARIMAFRDQPAAAIAVLEKVVSDYPQDPRVSLWQESLAWACFAATDYLSAVEWAQMATEGDTSATCKSFAYLVQAASYHHLSLRLPAQMAWDSANRIWPGKLNLDRDVRPLFIGCRTDLSLHFLSALRSLD